MKKTFACILVFSAFIDNAIAQIDLTASIAVPVGDFAAVDDGMAQTRFGISGAYYKALSPQMSIGGEVGFIMNTLDRAAFATALLDQGASDVSVGGGTYFNYPVFASLLFSPEPLLAHGISLYGSAGIDFMRMMEMDLEINGNAGTIEFDPGSAFAWAAGAQIAFAPYFFGIRYLNLGQHTISGKIISDSGSEYITGTQKVSVVNFLFGLRI